MWHMTHNLKLSQHWQSPVLISELSIQPHVVAAGMGKEVENLIMENNELLATKYIR